MDNSRQFLKAFGGKGKKEKPHFLGGHEGTKIFRRNPFNCEGYLDPVFQERYGSQKYIYHCYLSRST